MEGSLAAGRLPARSDVPVPPIGALPVMPLPIVGLPAMPLLMVGLLMPEPELVLVSMEGVDGMVVTGGVTSTTGGVLDDDEGIVVVDPVSSTFLPQAPKANTAERATAAMTAGLKFENCICRSFVNVRFGLRIPLWKRRSFMT